MRRAHCVEAVTSQKFFFRKYMAPPESVEACAIGEAGNGAAAVASCIAAAAMEVRPSLLSIRYLQVIRLAPPTHPGWREHSSS
jgi:hypothetical protein